MLSKNGLINRPVNETRNQNLALRQDAERQELWSPDGSRALWPFATVVRVRCKAEERAKFGIKKSSRKIRNLKQIKLSLIFFPV